MALTADIIKADTALNSLTDEQISAISALSTNDEKVTIDNRIRDLHNQYDNDIKTVTGIDRNQDEKSYVYLKRVLNDYKTKHEGLPGLQQKVTSYETEIASLKQAIADGKGNETIKQQLKDVQDKLKAKEDQYKSERSAWDQAKSEYDNQITRLAEDTEFNKAMTGLKFKSSYPESVQKTLLTSAIALIREKYKMDWVDADGKKAVVFRNEKGEIARNTANSLNPYTAKELIKEQLKEALDDKPGGGGGTTPPGGGSPTIDLVDVAGAKNQVEADEMIAKYLLQTGELRGTSSFADKHRKIREESGISKLPIR
jgi:hypothetical protein